MDQGSILHQLPLPSEYNLPNEHECIGSFTGASPHSSYTNGSAVDPTRRDGTLQHSSFMLNDTKPGRFGPNGSMSETSNFRSGNNFTDSSSGSISASPSSHTSSLAFNTLQSPHYTNLPGFANAVPLHPTTLVPNVHAGFPRAPSILDSATSAIPPLHNHLRASVPSTTSSIDRESYHPTPSLGRSYLPANACSTFTETPRSVFSPSHSFPPLPGLYAGHMASPTQNYPQPASPPQDCATNFQWPNLEVTSEITCQGQPVTPEIRARVEKGFFLANCDQKWTCYRRNYFAVNCSFELHPTTHNAPIYLKRSNSTSEQIQAMGMCLSAAIDGTGGKFIELIQHTPKRDNGPKTKVEITRVAPSSTASRTHDHTTMSPHGVYQMPMATFHPTGTVPGPYLPFQNSPEPSTSSDSSSQPNQIAATYPYANPQLPIPGQNTSQTFERVQFKSATANNGKRRASQQYFHLIVELFADVRKDGATKTVWVKVAKRTSEKIVVRGRSPSHYQHEGQNNQGGRSGSNGGGAYGGSGGATYGALNPGAFRGSGGSYGLGNMGFRSNNYGLQGSPGDSPSSPESVDGGAMDSDHQMDTIMTETERAGIPDLNGYSYHPGTIYETLPNHLPLPKIETTGVRYGTDPRNWAYRAEYADAEPGPQWEHALGRYQGFPSSQGLFPNLSTSATGYS